MSIDLLYDWIKVDLQKNVDLSKCVFPDSQCTKWKEVQHFCEILLADILLKISSKYSELN
jgi:hypothetical protein